VKVVDASAVLAFLQGEAGANVVEEALSEAAVVGAANWSEVAQKVMAGAGDWDLARALLQSYDITIEPVSAHDAEQAARSWRKGTGLSLADRLCLALADRLDAEVLTADRARGDGERIRQVR
jgi:ribonuclease VapC